jgi:hypothetical protein
MRSGGKSFAALGSAGVNDGTAGLGAHPGTKAMASFAFYIAWLKRSLAHFYILLGCPCQPKDMATPHKGTNKSPDINMLHGSLRGWHHADKYSISKIY